MESYLIAPDWAPVELKKELSRMDKSIAERKIRQNEALILIGAEHSSDDSAYLKRQKDISSTLYRLISQPYMEPVWKALNAGEYKFGEDVQSSAIALWNAIELLLNDFYEASADGRGPTPRDKALDRLANELVSLADEIHKDPAASTSSLSFYLSHKISITDLMDEFSNILKQEVKRSAPIKTPAQGRMALRGFIPPKLETLFAFYNREYRNSFNDPIARITSAIIGIREDKGDTVLTASNVAATIRRSKKRTR